MVAIFRMLGVRLLRYLWVRVSLPALLCFSFLPSAVFSEEAYKEEGDWPDIESWQAGEDNRLVYQSLDEDNTPVFQKHWIEKSRDSITNSWKYFNNVVDSYVSQDDQNLINDSYLRLRLGNTFFRDGSKSTFDIKVKADLARTTNKLGLWADNTLNVFLDTDPDDQKSLQQQSFDRTFGKQDNNNGATAGISLGLAEFRRWSTDFDVGVKSGSPVDVFTRVKFVRFYEVSNKWKATWRHKLYAFYDRDSGYQSDFKIYRKISEKWNYSNTTEVKWNHDEKNLGYANISAFHQVVSSHSYAVWSFGGFYEDYPAHHLSSYFFEINYTRRLYEDWFFVQLVPRVDYFHVNDFGSTPSFLLRFEVLFSN